jgi:hypothetical protein
VAAIAAFGVMSSALATGAYFKLIALARPKIAVVEKVVLICRELCFSG